MTRQETIHQVALHERSVSQERAFIRGANWADKHPDISMVSVLAFEAAQRDTIEKAIEWLKKNAWRFMCCDEEADDEYYYDDRKLTRAFKQAMQL